MIRYFDEKYGDLFYRFQLQIHFENPYIRIFLGELLATFVATTIAIGSMTSAAIGYELSNPNRTGAAALPPPHPERLSSFPVPGNFVGVALATGLGYAFGVMITGGISGGLMNPALTLAMGIFARIRLSFVPVFWAAQYLGSFIAAAVVAFIYRDSIKAVDCQLDPLCERSMVTAEMFTSFPRGTVLDSPLACIADVLLAATLFSCMVFAMWDPRNLGARRELGAIFMGFAVTGIMLAFGYNAGAPINPARDLGPRLFLLVAGWGTSVFTWYYSYSWIPAVIPHVGCLIGALLYEFYAGFHFPYWIIDKESGTAKMYKSRKHQDGDDEAVTVFLTRPPINASRTTLKSYKAGLPATRYGADHPGAGGSTSGAAAEDKQVHFLLKPPPSTTFNPPSNDPNKDEPPPIVYNPQQPPAMSGESRAASSGAALQPAPRRRF